MSVAVIGANAGLRVINNALSFVAEIIFLTGGVHELISGVVVPSIVNDTPALFNARVAAAIDAEAATRGLTAVTAIYGMSTIQQLR